MNDNEERLPTAILVISFPFTLKLSNTHHSSLFCEYYWQNFKGCCGLYLKCIINISEYILNKGEIESVTIYQDINLYIEGKNTQNNLSISNIFLTFKFPIV